MRIKESRIHTRHCPHSRETGAKGKTPKPLQDPPALPVQRPRPGQGLALPEQWVVDCRRVGRGLPALQYLSRYLYRGVLPERNILGENAGLVTFRYRDSQSGQPSTRTLPAVQFLWLVLQHLLPKGFHRLRDYGFLRGNAQSRLQRIQLLQVTPTPRDDTPPRPLCPCCHLPMLWAGVRAARPPTLG
ncbi:transposase [Marinobacterium sp. OS208]|nr:transposase [Marinobacterium sedimentorum]